MIQHVLGGLSSEAENEIQINLAILKRLSSCSGFFKGKMRGMSLLNERNVLSLRVVQGWGVFKFFVVLFGFGFLHFTSETSTSLTGSNV